MKKKLWPGWWTASDRIPRESGRGLARSRWRCCRGPSGSRCCSWRGRPAGRTGGRPPGHQGEGVGNYDGTHCLVIEEVEMNAAIYRYGSLHKPNKCQMISKILRGGNCLEKVNKSIRSGGWRLLTNMISDNNCHRFLRQTPGFHQFFHCQNKSLFETIAACNKLI